MISMVDLLIVFRAMTSTDIGVAAVEIRRIKLKSKSWSLILNEILRVIGNWVIEADWKLDVF